MGARIGPGHLSPTELDETDGDSLVEDLEYYFDGEAFIGTAVGDTHDNFYWQSRLSRLSLSDSSDGIELQHRTQLDHSRPPTPALLSPLGPSPPESSFLAPNTTPAMGFPSPPVSIYDPSQMSGRESGHEVYPALLSSDVVVGEQKDFSLQKVDPFFTDPEQDYETAFSRQLNDLNGKNTYDTTIEKFIVKSEKDWFNRLRGVKMGKTKTPIGSVFQDKTGHSPAVSVYGVDNVEHTGNDGDQMRRQFLLADDYQPPTGMRKLLLHRLGDWPVYSLLLAFVSYRGGCVRLESCMLTKPQGQVMAANSYQITLLTGEVGESATKLYIIASIYLATSLLWW